MVAVLVLLASVFSAGAASATNAAGWRFVDPSNYFQAPQNFSYDASRVVFSVELEPDIAPGEVVQDIYFLTNYSNCFVQLPGTGSRVLSLDVSDTCMDNFNPQTDSFRVNSMLSGGGYVAVDIYSNTYNRSGIPAGDDVSAPSEPTPEPTSTPSEPAPEPTPEPTPTSSEPTPSPSPTYNGETDPVPDDYQPPPPEDLPSPCDINIMDISGDIEECLTYLLRPDMERMETIITPLGTELANRFPFALPQMFKSFTDALSAKYMDHDGRGAGFEFKYHMFCPEIDAPGTNNQNWETVWGFANDYCNSNELITYPILEEDSPGDKVLLWVRPILTGVLIVGFWGALFMYVARRVIAGTVRGVGNG